MISSIENKISIILYIELKTAWLIVSRLLNILKMLSKVKTNY